MKNGCLFLIILIFFSCISVPSKKTYTNRINGTWNLYKMKGFLIVGIENSKKRPFLTINENKVSGNNGCNNFFSAIDSITTNKIYFSPFGETRMMCNNMKIPDAFNKLISSVDAYFVRNNRLVFLKNKEEVLIFKK